MSSKEKKRRLRIILTTITAIVGLALLATALYFIIRTDEKDNSDNNDGSSDNAIDLEDVLSGQLYAKRFNGSWSNGNSLIYKESAVSTELNKLRNINTIPFQNEIPSRLSSMMPRLESEPLSCTMPASMSSTRSPPMVSSCSWPRTTRRTSGTASWPSTISITLTRARPRH